MSMPETVYNSVQVEQVDLEFSIDLVETATCCHDPLDKLEGRHEYPTRIALAVFVLLIYSQRLVG